MTERPKRVQRSRKKGWRKPEGAVIVDRTSRWGNPFTVKSAKSAGYKSPAQVVVSSFRDWLDGDNWACGCLDNYEEKRARILSEIETLRGKDLVYTCPLDQPCHADVLLEIANRNTNEVRE